MVAVLGAGLVAVDHMFLVNARSLRGAKPEFLGSSGGGSVGNTLCMIRLLGNSATSFGIVGNDPAGVLVRSDFQNFGVDTSYLISRGRLGDFRQTRQFSHVIYSTGTHSFRKSCMLCGSAFRREIQIGKEDLGDDLLARTRTTPLVHLDRANETTAVLAKQCAGGGGRVSFDFAFDSREDGTRWADEVLKVAELVKVSESVFRKRMGLSPGASKIEWQKLTRDWQKRFPKTSYLLVTRGEDGVAGYGQTDDGRMFFDRPAIHCGHFRDAAGAGDIFIAFAISELLASRKLPSDSHELEHAVDICQALASLSCTVYGARSLQHVFVSQKLSPQRIREAAEAIVQTGEAGNSISPLLGIPPRLSQLYRFEANAGCVVCGAPRTRSPPREAKKRPSLYVEELSKGPSAMNHAFEIGRAKSKDLEDFRQTPLLFVGSGGSFVAASFGEQLALRALGLPAKAMTPFEFERIPRMAKDTGIWLLSYGGGNADILAAAKHVVELGIKRCAVVTGTLDSKLAAFAKDRDWAVIPLLPQARGFVATVGMLAMMAALGGVLAPKEDENELRGFFEQDYLYGLFRSAERQARDKAARLPETLETTHLIALGSGWGWPAVVDFESKIVEGGVCTIEVSELKNYTHGRYINAFYHRRNRHFVLFRTPDDAELVLFFNERLKRYFDLTILTTMNKSLAGSLELLVNELFLASYLGKKVGRDLSRPKYPREARGLYGWRPRAISSDVVDFRIADE